MLNPAWLHTFKTLVETGHFTETANKLFMTQPGVSQHIKKLEANCGHSLITRNKKRFELTEQGRLVYSYAKDVKSNEVSLLERLNFDDPFSGVCKLACPGALALSLYPHLLELQINHPQLIIQLEVAPNSKIVKGIESGEFDFGIVTNQPSAQQFNFEKVGSDELCLILPKKQGDIALKEYGGDVLMCIKTLGLIDHPDAKHYLATYFSLSNLAELAKVNTSEIPVTGYVNQLVQILIPVSNGLGFTVLPQSAFDRFADRERLKIIKPNSRVMEHLLGVKARNRQLPARYKNVIEHIKTIIIGLKHA
ncbi:MAG: DNA-binding transcriptional LysR family regulator [Bermanella sp.]|jgi:DNA-binding transcriptional LysR family regulator